MASAIPDVLRRLPELAERYGINAAELDVWHDHGLLESYHYANGFLFSEVQAITAILQATG